MTYSTTWYHLDKNNNILESFEQKACFSPIRNRNFAKDTQYLLYDFSNMNITQKQARDYFLFLKTIPEFKELMPKSCTQMAKDMKYKVDLHKFNGTKIFTILTVIRAVVEDPDIVKQILKFKRKHKYSLSNLCILKMCGSVHQNNCGHWITMRVDSKNLDKEFKSKTWWDKEEPCINTGLGANIFDTFNNAGNGYSVISPISHDTIKRILDETEPKKKVVKKQMNLQLEGL